MMAQTVYQAYLSIIDPNHPSLNEDIEDDNYPLPEFTNDMLKKLFIEAVSTLQKIPMVVELQGPIVVVGDIHGNIRDLIRIIRANGNPSNTKYIFLGDYVDRGEFSLEVLTLLLSIQVAFPENITLLRGNHECEDVSSFYGFKSEIQERHNSLDLFKLAVSVFENLSLAALCEGHLCIHGGICKEFTNIKDIENITKPLNLDTAPKEVQAIVEGILWSDPYNVPMMYANSQRGRGCLFGEHAVNQFCQENQIKSIIRGHSLAPKGIKKEMGGLVVTVFSSGYYIPGQFPNKPGYLTISNGKTFASTLPAMPQMQRAKVSFIKHSNTYSLKGRLCGLQIGPGAPLSFFSSPRKGDNQTKSLASSLTSINSHKSSAPFIVKRSSKINLLKVRSSSKESLNEAKSETKLPSFKKVPLPSIPSVA